MGKGPCSFRVNDAKRGVRACEEAGLTVTGVTINPRIGEIRIETNKSAPPSNPDHALAEWTASNA